MSKIDEYIEKAGITKYAYFYKSVFLFSNFLWVVLVLFVRKRVEDPTIQFYLGFIPNFFAGIAIYFFLLFYSEKVKWLKKMYSNYLSIAISVFLILFIGELLQGYVMGKVYDILDLVASYLGIMVSIAIHFFIDYKFKLPEKKMD